MGQPCLVEFHVMDTVDVAARDVAVCELITRLYAQRGRVFVNAPDIDTAYRLDELLWRVKGDQFIPHNTADEPITPVPAVQFGCGLTRKTGHNIVINLAENLDRCFTHYVHVIEVVPDDEDAKARLRLHYRQYQQLGCHVRVVSHAAAQEA